jgi:hypothetical protein
MYESAGILPSDLQRRRTGHGATYLDIPRQLKDQPDHAQLC